MKKISWLILATGCMELVAYSQTVPYPDEGPLFLCSASSPSTRRRGTHLLHASPKTIFHSGEI